MKRRVGADAWEKMWGVWHGVWCGLGMACGVARVWRWMLVRLRNRWLQHMASLTALHTHSHAGKGCARL